MKHGSNWQCWMDGGNAADCEQEKMTVLSMRARMLAFVHGQPQDRVPFVLASGFSHPSEEVWRVVGRENLGILRGTQLHRCETPNCRFETELAFRDGKTVHRRTLITPAGSLMEEYFPGEGHAPAGHFIREARDYHILLSYFRDMEVIPTFEDYFEAERSLGQNGIVQVQLPKTPLFRLRGKWVDPRDLAYHQVEYPEIMEEVFTCLATVQRRIFEVVCAGAMEMDVPYVIFGDRIDAASTSETVFRAHCLPAYSLLAGMLGETGRKVPVFIQAHGPIHPLWNLIAQASIDGLDALPLPPEGDTSLADGLARWPAMRFGVRFPKSPQETDPMQRYQQTLALLEAGGHSGRLQLYAPAHLPGETWRVDYPSIIQAIHDFYRSG